MVKIENTLLTLLIWRKERQHDYVDDKIILYVFREIHKNRFDSYLLVFNSLHECINHSPLCSKFRGMQDI